MGTLQQKLARLRRHNTSVGEKDPKLAEETRDLGGGVEALASPEAILPMITHSSRQANPLSQATKVMVICLAMLSNSELLAATDEGITKEYSICMEKSQGVTVSMLHCAGDELDRQDARLNDNYKKLMSKLSRNRKKVLLEAQRAWIKFRKTNCDFYYDPNGGSAARLAGSGCFLTMTAARAKELKDLLGAE